MALKICADAIGTYFTPATIAKRYSVSIDKVLLWISRGELRAINVASTITPGSHRMVLEIGGRQGQSGTWAIDIEEGSIEGGRRWDVDVAPMGEARTLELETQKQAKLEREEKRLRERIDADKRKIIAVAVKYPEGKSKTFLRDNAGINSTRFAPAFNELLEDGNLVRRKIIEGNRRTPIDGYAVPTNT